MATGGILAIAIGRTRPCSQSHRSSEEQPICDFETEMGMQYGGSRLLSDRTDFCASLNPDSPAAGAIERVNARRWFVRRNVQVVKS